MKLFPEMRDSFSRKEVSNAPRLSRRLPTVSKDLRRAFKDTRTCVGCWLWRKDLKPPRAGPDPTIVLSHCYRRSWVRGRNGVLNYWGWRTKGRSRTGTFQSRGFGIKPSRWSVHRKTTAKSLDWYWCLRKWTKEYHMHESCQSKRQAYVSASGEKLYTKQPALIVPPMPQLPVPKFS